MPAREAAAKYAREAGIDYHPPTEYVKVDPERAKRIADAYDAMPHAPHDPEVKAAYDALSKETIAQYKAMLGTGLKVEFIDYAKQGDPYAASPRLATEDVRKNNHLWVFPTSAGFGSNETFDAADNPLLADSGVKISGQPATVNDLFRAVHDYYGHIKEGNGFRADGEENAWRSHSAMFSPLARRAMTTETRGQNSWVNFGPYGETNRTAGAGQTHFADQKTGLLPEWVTREGSGQPDDIGGDVTKLKPSDFTPTNPAAKDSLTRFTRPDGSLDPRRKALHSMIVDSVLKGGVPNQRQPEFVMLGGGPASGKSTALKAGVRVPPGGVTINSDDIKAMLPEFHGGDPNDKGRAAFVHEESSAIAKEAMNKAIAQKMHVTLDGTGDSSIEKVLAKSSAFRAHGYKVVGEYVTADLDKAIERSNARGQKTGRYVPEDVIRAVHRSVSNVLPQAVHEGAFDEMRLWDTNDGPPKMIASYDGKKLTVHDAAAYDKFLAKGAAK